MNAKNHDENVQPTETNQYQDYLFDDFDDYEDIYEDWYNVEDYLPFKRTHKKLDDDDYGY